MAALWRKFIFEFGVSQRSLGLFVFWILGSISAASERSYGCCPIFFFLCLPVTRQLFCDGRDPHATYCQRWFD